MVELFYYFLILIVIIFAYGISTRALMFQMQDINLYLLETVFFSGYFVLFGTNQYSDIMLNDSDYCSKNVAVIDPTCPDYIGRKISLFIYTIYVIFLVILAINMLIAIFKLEKEQFISYFFYIFLCFLVLVIHLIL